MEHHWPVCNAVVEYENWQVKRMKPDDPRKEKQMVRVSYFIVLNEVFY